VSRHAGMAVTVFADGSQGIFPDERALSPPLSSCNDGKHRLLNHLELGNQEVHDFGLIQRARVFRNAAKFNPFGNEQIFRK
jgi:hypothetical protein